MNTGVQKSFIDFIITQACSFKCRYCSQSKAQAKNYYFADDKTLKSFYKLLDKLDKNFEITITGGEAMLHPKFFEIITKVTSEGFKLNLITNGSMPEENYKKVFEIANKNLNNFDISFHLDEIKDFNSYILKIDRILNIIPKCSKTNFYIPIYKLNQSKKEKIEIITNLAKKYFIEIEFQHIRILDKYIRYSKEEQKFFLNEKPPTTRGKLCFSGFKSVVIYENGECYRCYSSRFLKTNRIGNINSKNFRLNSEPLICTKKFCTCPKPKKYGQITDIKAKGAIIADLKNILMFPYLFLKNKDIVIQKLKQKLIKSD